MLISCRSSVKHSPPVRLKEFPKAENELRGVKSGLLGLLAGLHKPELDVTGGKCNTQRCILVSAHRPVTHGFADSGRCVTGGHSGYGRQAPVPKRVQAQRGSELLAYAGAVSQAQSRCSVERTGILFFPYVDLLVMED